MTDEPLKPHQLAGAQWLSARQYALLADDMGVGKTAQTIRACDILGARRITVVCPAIATTNWAREFALWSIYDTPCNIIATGEHPAVSDGVNIVSYNLMSTVAVYQRLAATRPQVLVLDEAHYLKNRESLRHKVVFGNRRDPHVRGLMQISGRCYALSGTPMPRDPRDLWPWLRYFGAYPKGMSNFEKEFCRGYTDNRGNFVVTGVKNAKRLRELLAQIMLRRRLTDVTDKVIPVSIDTFVIEGVPVDPEIEYGVGNKVHKKQDERCEKGEALVSEAIANLPDDKVIASINSLKIGRNTPVSTLRRHTGLLKVANAAAFIKDQLDNYHASIVVFAIHKAVIEGLVEALRLYNPVTIWGGMKQHKKDSKILQFERGKSRVAICNIGAAGTAIRFKMSDAVVIVEPDWNPANNAQAIARCLWLGREKPLPVTYLSLAESYDEHVNRVLARKTIMTQELFD